MRLLIAGDLTLQDRAASLQWNESQMMKSFTDVKNIVQGCDYSVVNLESPVTDGQKIIKKDGPTLKNIPAIFDIIKYCGFNVVTLANNHLKDYGGRGVMDTIDHCKKQKLMYVGAGDDVNNARKPLIISCGGGGTIGILNVCEHESSIATSASPGANPLDIPNLYQDLSALRKDVDKIVLVVHGGREHYSLPTPRMKREFRMLLDFGADVIVNHHQHCYSGYEVYNGKPIFYGLGNFFFDSASKRNNKWNEGLLLQMDIDKNKTDFKLIPYEQCNEEVVVKILDNEKVRYQLENLNAIIKDDRLLESEFESYAQTSKIMSPFLPFGNIIMRSLYYRGLLPSCVSLKNKVLMENAVSCETHREVLLTYLNKQLHNE